MPIHLNLLAEARAAEDMRRRDPVKRAIYIGIALVVLFLGWAATLAVLNMASKAALTNTKTKIDAKTNAFQSVQVQQQKLAQARNKLVALQRLQAARFLYGNLLNALQQTTVDGVQLTRLHVDQTFTTQEPESGQINAVARVRETLALHLGAKDSSANPGEQVNKFQSAIAKSDYFQAMLSKTNGIQLAGPPSALQMDATRPYVTFTLDCRFKDQAR